MIGEGQGLDQRRACSAGNSSHGIKAKTGCSGVGVPHDPKTGEMIKKMSIGDIVDQLLQLDDNTKLIILSPYQTNKETNLRTVIDRLKRNGFIRARIDNKIIQIDSENTKLPKTKFIKVQAVVDSVVGRVITAFAAITDGELMVDVIMPMRNTSGEKFADTQALAEYFGKRVRRLLTD